MNRIVPLALVLGAFAFMFSAVAEEKVVSKAEGKTCPAACKAGAKDGACCAKGEGKCCDKSACASKEAVAAAAMSKLPKMTYLVGKESTCCSESAAAIAKKSELPIQFIVGKETFSDKTKAMTVLVSTTEKFVEAFAKPHTCEKSGTITVAGKSCGCPVEAGALTKLVATTMKNVKMTYAVGEKSCECPVEAKALAEDSGKKTEYVVNGKKTCCNLTARLNLAQAKYVAIFHAIAKQDAEATASKAKPETKDAT